MRSGWAGVADTTRPLISDLDPRHASGPTIPSMSHPTERLTHARHAKQIGVPAELLAASEIALGKVSTRDELI